MNDRDDVRSGRHRAGTGRPPGRPPPRSSRPVRPIAAVLAGAVLMSAPVGLAAQELAADAVSPGDAAVGAEAATPDPAASGLPGGGMIPRDALVDMARAQSRLVCASEVFLGCMGFDGTMCRSLSESAIDQCLMTLPATIDPALLDNAALESCPKAVYAKAGHEENEAQACLAEALEEF